jgi:hypothetical protein
VGAEQVADRDAQQTIGLVDCHDGQPLDPGLGHPLNVRTTRGLGMLRLGALAAARDDPVRSVQADADNPDSWGLLALAEARLGHRPEAYAALGRVTRLEAGGGASRMRPMPADLKREASRLILDAAGVEAAPPEQVPADPARHQAVPRQHVRHERILVKEWVGSGRFHDLAAMVVIPRLRGASRAGPLHV